MTALLEQALAPTENDKRLASEARRFLAPLMMLSHDARVQFLDEDTPQNVLSLPSSALRLLNEILKEMAKGNGVIVMPVHAMLTTQEAADLLNVSRPFLIGLLEAGEIPYQRLGSHRKILSQDLMAFRDKADAEREEALRQLTEEAQELGMGY